MVDLLEDAEQIGTMEGKHDSTYKQFLFKIDGENYATWVGFSYNNGIEDGPYTLTQVFPRTKVVTEWVEELVDS